MTVLRDENVVLEGNARAFRWHDALFDRQRHAGHQRFEIVALVVDLHADEVANAVVVVLVVAAGLAQHLHGLVVQFPPGDAGANHGNHGFLHVEGNFVELALLVRHASADRHVALDVGRVVIERGAGVGPHHVAVGEAGASRARHELDPAFRDGLLVGRRLDALAADRRRETERRAVVAVDEVHDLHDLGFGHPGAGGAECHGDAVPRDLDGSPEVRDRPGVLQHADAVEDVGRIASDDLGREALDLLEGREANRFGHTEAEEARIVEVQDLVVLAPGAGERGRERPAPHLRDAPVAEIGHGDRQVVLEHGERPDVVDARAGRERLGVPRRVQHDPVANRLVEPAPGILVRRQQQQRGVEAVDTVEPRQVDEIVVVGVRHLEFEPALLCALDRVDQHCAGRDRTQHALAAPLEDGAQRVRIRVVDVEAVREAGLLAEVVVERQRCLGRRVGGDE